MVHDERTCGHVFVGAFALLPGFPVEDEGTVGAGAEGGGITFQEAAFLPQAVAEHHGGRGALEGALHQPRWYPQGSAFPFLGPSPEE